MNLIRGYCQTEVIAHYLAISKNYPPLGLGGERCVVGNKYERDIVLQMQLFHQVKDMLPVLGIEIAGRFVRQ